MQTHASHIKMLTSKDGAVLLDTRLGKLSRLNPTGAQVWEALGRGDDVPTIVADLARETDCQIAVLERDVRDFIETLRAQQLLAD